jgi:hypothetical protein
MNGKPLISDMNLFMDAPSLMKQIGKKWFNTPEVSRHYYTKCC